MLILKQDLDLAQCFIGQSFLMLASSFDISPKDLDLLLIAVLTGFPTFSLEFLDVAVGIPNRAEFCRRVRFGSFSFVILTYKSLGILLYKSIVTRASQIPWQRIKQIQLNVGISREGSC